jgi:hypothetical protein
MVESNAIARVHAREVRKRTGDPINAIALAALCLLPAGPSAGPVEDLEAWLKTDRAGRPALASQPFAEVPLTASESMRARDLLWTDRLAYVKTQWAAQWTGKKLVDKNGFQMPFDYRIYGAKPAKGYDLYISMHGGGGTTKETNDGQWNNQILLYQPNGVYLAPRAPTDTWNMWHRDHIDGFFDQLIQLCVANLGANPDRVYLMGYSAGGDGAYQMAPRMADRWAASAMMAGYPNNASPINLRNIGFTMHVGALDAAYNRNTIATVYGNAIQKLQDADPGFYEYDVQVHAGKGHWMDLEDKAALGWMDDFTRKPLPSKVVWQQDTTVGTNSFPSNGPVVGVKGKTTQFRFHWIGLRERNPAAAPARITAEIKGQEVAILESNLDSLEVSLNDSLLDLDKPVRVLWKGKAIHEGPVHRTISNLHFGMNDRGDREYSFPTVLFLRKSMVVTSIRDGVAPRIREMPAWTGLTLEASPRGLAVRFRNPPGRGRIRLADIAGSLVHESAIPAGGDMFIPTGNAKGGLHILSIRAAGGDHGMRIVLP